MPFLVASVMAELDEQGLAPQLVTYPRFVVVRDAEGRLVSLRAANPLAASAGRESLIQVHVERIDDPGIKTTLVAELKAVLADVRSAVQGWGPMLERLGMLIEALKSAPPTVASDDVAEAIALLEWLGEDNFTFLGLRDYSLSQDAAALVATSAPALGIFGGSDSNRTGPGSGRLVLTPRGLAALREPHVLMITKTTSRSRVHRRTAMDQVVVKHYGPDGKLTGATQIVGLFTATAYVRPTGTIPYLRRKVAAVMARSGFDAMGHSGRALANILETYPRDDMFQIEEDTLFQFALTILQLNERPRVRVLPRRDTFERFVSVLVYVPRERYDSTARAAIGDLLATAFDGAIASFVPFFPEGPVVRIHFVVARRRDRQPRELLQPPRAGLEAGVVQLLKTWPDRLLDALMATYDSITARALFGRFGGAFSAAYREAFSPQIAVGDIAAIEALSPDAPLGVDFAPGDGEDGKAASLKVWSHGRPIPLSERVPVLEHMGFTVVDESTYHVGVGDGEHRHVWLHDMQLDRMDGSATNIASAKPRLDSCLAAVLRGAAESDGYNALVLAAGLAWRDVALVRALSRYLRQIGVPYSQDYMWTTHVKHADVAARIVALFAARFDPSAPISPQRADQEAAIAAEIEALLVKVGSLDEDRIIRHFVNAVQSAVRTNFYQLPKPVSGQTGNLADAEGPPVAIKFDSRKLTGLPLPRPRCEIFICSPRLEAVHLRFGAVARGGIRWSDRPQDFRTEVLGLVKAQQVKNAVIVPVGAKGGFVPKRLPTGNRDAIQAEGTATYRIFMSTMLDITDNLDGSTVVPPANVVRHDGDDPYLVVAADKGTATFSDLANAIASEHGFWLDDAFASGGSAGYDHKKIGITARGAWESVKRHFREMDVDISKVPFTVAGVGDMSGDVFGNGMLRALTIRLVAAFDHRDIFIDPNPDPIRSFAERQRLFDLPRSSWQDFDRTVISAGGGVFSRAVKEIDLSVEARTALGITAEKTTPQEVISAILKAPVDLLWFGGIGTYVRSETESQEAVGDRANDAIRIAASDLRCKVIGEGANLGMTQRGRVAAALRGIRLNTDAIDNSAGVNTSDVEVNLKIALSLPMRDGRLTRPDRNALLAGLTDEVAALVLRNNYQQTLALSVVQRRGLDDLGFQQRLMRWLEQRQLLDRAVEYLPNDMEVAERRRRGEPLTRPELAVLLAYAKLALHEDLLHSTVPDDPYLARELVRYFPPAVAARFPDAIESHRLRRDIIATQLANSMINRGGPALVIRLADQTGMAVDRIAAAFAVVRDSFGLAALNAAIEELDNRISGTVQLGLFAQVQNLLIDRMVWFLRNVELGRGLAEVVDHYRDGISAVREGLDRFVPEAAQRDWTAAVAKLTAEGVPDPVAQTLARLPALGRVADIVLIADRGGCPIDRTAAIYFAAEDHFRLDRIAAAAGEIKLTDYFDRLAFDRALDAIGDALRWIVGAITAQADCAATTDDGAGAAVAAFVQAKGADVERVRQAVHEIVASGLTLSKLTVAAGLLSDLTKG